jgi:hypothetical protein
LPPKPSSKFHFKNKDHPTKNKRVSKLHSKYLKKRNCPSKSSLTEDDDIKDVIKERLNSKQRHNQDVFRNF